MRVLRALAAALMAVFVVTAAVSADTPPAPPKITIDRSKLLVPPKNPDGSISVTPFSESPVLWARDEQQRFYSAMSGKIKALRGQSPWAAALSLMLLSFGYGVFHAAGPGHGKAVISGWLLATESQLRRGIMVAFMSSMFQAVTAVLLVTVPLLLVAGAAETARAAAGFFESVSFVMVAALGLYLVWTGLRALRLARAAVLAAAPAASGSVPRVDLGQRFEIVSSRMDDGHVHGPDCGCGHEHVPAAAEVKGDWSWRRALSLSLAVGLRPCTGALLVLIFANAFGLYWAGIASTFAMALGTFITVSAIATLAVTSKALAVRWARRDDRWLARLGVGLRLAAGISIASFGALMFVASLSGPVPGM